MNLEDTMHSKIGQSQKYEYYIIPLIRGTSRSSVHVSVILNGLHKIIKVEWCLLGAQESRCYKPFRKDAAAETERGYLAHPHCTANEQCNQNSSRTPKFKTFSITVQVTNETPSNHLTFVLKCYSITAFIQHSCYTSLQYSHFTAITKGKDIPSLVYEIKRDFVFWGLW